MRQLTNSADIDCTTDSAVCTRNGEAATVSVEGGEPHSPVRYGRGSQGCASPSCLPTTPVTIVPQTPRHSAFRASFKAQELHGSLAMNQRFSSTPRKRQITATEPDAGSLNKISRSLQFAVQGSEGHQPVRPSQLAVASPQTSDHARIRRKLFSVGCLSESPVLHRQVIHCHVNVNNQDRSRSSPNLRSEGMSKPRRPEGFVIVSEQDRTQPLPPSSSIPRSRRRVRTEGPLRVSLTKTISRYGDIAEKVASSHALQAGDFSSFESPDACEGDIARTGIIVQVGQSSGGCYASVVVTPLLNSEYRRGDDILLLSASNHVALECGTLTLVLPAHRMLCDKTESENSKCLPPEGKFLIASALVPLPRTVRPETWPSGELSLRDIGESRLKLDYASPSGCTSVRHRFSNQSTTASCDMKSCNQFDQLDNHADVVLVQGLVVAMLFPTVAIIQDINGQLGALLSPRSSRTRRCDENVSTWCRMDGCGLPFCSIRTMLEERHATLGSCAVDRAAHTVPVFTELENDTT